MVCGEVAEIALSIPSTLLTVIGAVNGCPSKVICNPCGFVLIVSVDVFGKISVKEVSFAPCESVTTRYKR